MAGPRNRPIVVALVILGATIAAIGCFALSLRFAGRLIPYRIPASGMHPTIQVGDCVLMEGITYWFRAPQRGEVVVFRTKGIAALHSDDVYVKRIAGLPGDKLRIAEGRLYVNGQPAPPIPGAGPYVNATSSRFLRTARDEFLVPPESYFVLGDNSVNSADSRYWGTVPKPNVRGKIWFRYWPWR